MKNQSANVTDPALLRSLANCLLDYLKVHGKPGRAFEVLQFIAQETLRALDEGKEPRFNNYAIRSGVTGETEGDASAWLSRLWNSINREIRERREEGLQKFAADRGLRFYPWVAKLETSGGAGNQALYFLVATPLPEAAEHKTPGREIHPGEISYIPAENLQPSWWARWLFNQDRIASGWRKHLLIWPNLIWFTVIGLFGVLLFVILGQNTAPLAARELMLTIFLALIAWYCTRVVKRFERLVDDRMIMASDAMVGFREFGVCLELFKPEGALLGDRKSLRMVKYAAQCPICAAQVLLDPGEPDFPRRIVGRCQESPREHVFSFDRATRTGYRLR
jgi:hypothetical protein